MMDVSNAIVAKSDQLNAIDLTGRDVTVTITDVKPGPADQPVHIITDMFGPSRPFKASKTALRDIVQAWGTDSKVWVGRRLALWNDPSVLWAGKPVGGIRIRAMSHIDAPFKANHVITRGKTEQVMIQPLPDVARVTPPTVDPVKITNAITAANNATTITELDKIEDYARKLGIHTDTDLAAKLDLKRAELGETAN